MGIITSIRHRVQNIRYPSWARVAPDGMVEVRPSDVFLQVCKAMHWELTPYWYGVIRRCVSNYIVERTPPMLRQDLGVRIVSAHSPFTKDPDGPKFQEHLLPQDGRTMQQGEDDFRKYYGALKPVLERL